MKIDTNKLSNFGVLIIALSALFVSVWQVKISHKHNKLSVKPFLDYHIEQIDSTLTVSISNQGFGPAIISKVSFNYKGITYNSLEELLVGSGEIRNRIGSYQYGENSVIASGEYKLLVKLINREIRGVNVKVIYKTIYEEQGEFKFKF